MTSLNIKPKKIKYWEYKYKSLPCILFIVKKLFLRKDFLSECAFLPTSLAPIGRAAEPLRSEWSGAEPWKAGKNCMVLTGAGGPGTVEPRNVLQEGKNTKNPSFWLL